MQNLWSEILTAAVNLPEDHPAKETALQAMENAQRKATETAALFSPPWYDAAVDAIMSDDPAAQRFFVARLSEAYRSAHTEIA